MNVTHASNNFAVIPLESIQLIKYPQRPPVSSISSFRRAKFEGVTARRTAPDENFVKSNYWSYTRVLLRQPVLMHAHDHLDTLALRMFNSLLTFANWDATERPESERILVVQLLIHKCLENEDLCNEFYMQLIKQTTDNTGEEMSLKISIDISIFQS